MAQKLMLRGGVGARVHVIHAELELIQLIWHRSQCCGVKWGARVLRVRSVSREEVCARVVRDGGIIIYTPGSDEHGPWF